MPLLCAMRRGREKEKEVVVEERQRAASVAVAVPRRGRWSDGEQQPSAASAGRAGWRCRSCAAAAIADCVALGCCPCALVTLVALALVRAPIAVGRRLRRRKPSLQLLRRKRVRDVEATAKRTARDNKGAKAAGAAAAEPVQQQQPQDEVVEEPAWLDEMYRAGHWGFGRVSFSGSIGGGENPNPVTGRSAGS